MLDKIISGQHLSQSEAETLMTRIMTGTLSEIQIAGYLTALAAKGESEEEVTGFAKVMREKSTKVPVTVNGDVLFDCCGTGGSRLHTFNISTIVGIIAAAAGIKVAKHGNRSASSKCGSADVLEMLGINLEEDVNSVADSILKKNFGFMFAPFLHQAMKYVMPVRKGLAVRTVFNILGPLTNPANANTQLLGVFDPELTEIMARVLGNIGVKRAMVVHGEGGLDEISTLGKTKITELRNGDVQTYIIDVQEFGLPKATSRDIMGKDKEENAKMVIEILSGKKGPKRDIVLLNSAFALVLGNIATSPIDGINKAAAIIDSGLALEKLKDLKGAA
ncbi:MAG: anthranilate phosphoribosyltransferase [Candidatus Marinimicrobia bacterium]|nr:anthranilate phosphoribosyltransferase [Candidatus Neomarinimicrobiota bacterium]